jgi:hypothetical protein
MNKVFNLKAFYKKAYYDDMRALWNVNERAFNNCAKHKMEEGGKQKKSMHEAKMECIKDFNEMGKVDFSLKYTKSCPEAIVPRKEKVTDGSKGQTEVKEKKQ